MAEIIEVITKLSVQAQGNETLEKQIQMFQKESAAIDELTKKKEILERQSAKDQNPQRAERAKKAIADLNTQINAQTAALTKQVQQHQIVQRAAQQELGIIQKLQDKLQDLQQARERQTTAQGIREINVEMAKLNEELKDLTTTNQAGEITGGKGLLSQLFGVSGGVGAGRQVLQGVLQGLGIGGALSIIPSIVSNLVEYTQGILDSRAAVYQMNEAVLTLNASLASQLNAFNDFNKKVSEGFFGGVNTFDAQIQRVQALGVVNGEVFDARKKQFDAEQQRRDAELQQLSEVQEKYRLLNNALVTYDKTRSRPDLEQRISGIGFSEAELIRIKKSIDDTFKEIDKLPRSQREKAFNDLRLANNKEFLADQATTQERVNKLIDEGETAKIKFTQDTNRQIYELNRKLQIENTTIADQIELEEIARRERTNENINRQYNIRGKIATDALNREYEEARKNGILTTEIKKQFDEKFKNIEKQTEADREEALRQFNLQQLREQQQLNDKLLQEELRSLTQRAQLLTGVEFKQNIALRDAVSNAELNAAKAKNAEEYDITVQALEKKAREMESAGQTETREYEQVLDNLYQIYITYAKKQEDAETQAQAKRIQNIQQGYSDVIRVSSIYINQINSQFDLATAETREKFSKVFDISGNLANGAFGADFAKRVDTISNSIDKNNKLLEQYRIQLDAAQQAEDAAIKKRNEATDDTRVAAQQAVDIAVANTDKIKATIANLNADTAELDKERYTLSFKEAIKAYTQITDIAKNAYDQIHQYRLQDLDREISVTQERMSVAVELAKMGNTQLLEQEQKYLRDREQERRRAILRERQLAAIQAATNYALAISQSVVAITKTAASGGALAPVLIPAVIAAIGGGIATVSAIVGASRASQTTGFAEGGYTGDGEKYQVAGDVHKGEFVFDKETTARHRAVFEEIHRTGEIPMLRRTNYNPYERDGEFASKQELKELKGALYEVRDAVSANKVNVSQRVDERGVQQMVTRQTVRDHRKWSNR